MENKATIQKNKIFDAISELILAGGLANVTINNIAKKINKTKNLLFYYFENKEDMLREYVKYYINDEDVSYFPNKASVLEMEDAAEGLSAYIKNLYSVCLDLGFEYYLIFRELLSLCAIDDVAKEYFISLQHQSYNDFVSDLTFYRERGVLNETIDIEKIAVELLVELSGISLTASTYTLPHEYIEKFIELRANSMLLRLLKE